MVKKRIFTLFWIALGVFIADVTYRYGFEFLAVPTSSMQSTIEAGDNVWVNKLKPGPRFYSNKINSYFRIKLSDDLKVNDIIVFNFPDADTAFTEKPGESYYLLKRQSAVVDSIVQQEKWGKLMALKVHQRPRMIKRIVGLPGDTIVIKNGELLVNGRLFEEPPTGYRAYNWTGDTTAIQELEELLKRDIPINRKDHKTVIHLINNEIPKLKEWEEFLSQKTIRPGIYDPHIFPFTKNRRWSSDNMGPVVLPKKGVTVELTPKNLDLYKRLVNVFECENIELKGNYLFNDNIPLSKYTFKMDYYWVHGDNKPKSFDSRYWGPVPENHIVGVVRP